MVDLDDVVPSEEARRGPQSEEGADTEAAGRGVTAGGAEGRGATRQPAETSGRKDKSDAEEEGAIQASKPRKRLKKVVR